jgi:hypothetical protein
VYIQNIGTKGNQMYWAKVIAELLKVDITIAEAVYERMYSFDFSEASDTEIKREAKLVLRCMK